ncbi:hypothetical protein LOTGIDRAFT_164067 [Lottia gigantea]|uniref:Uncharacterized protein n=1 Tax=Lottia gigantea TaxID=225164 RepID=V4AB15_LOTGI|nr:hypothetical protein LOTGIDRAFT_164067 [Lottia gigantea]ESO90486.1 hypothetical protein LOTGIDRAFT_164067 [Lottia gigantea]
MFRMEFVTAVFLMTGFILNTTAVNTTEQISDTKFYRKYFHDRFYNNHYINYYRNSADNDKTDTVTHSYQDKVYYINKYSQYNKRSTTPFTFFFPIIRKFIEEIKAKNKIVSNWGNSFLLTALCNYYLNVGIQSSLCT